MTALQTMRRKLVRSEWTPEARKLRKVVTRLRVSQLARVLRLKT